jgi:hypothetical protein
MTILQTLNTIQELSHLLMSNHKFSFFPLALRIIQKNLKGAQALK